MGYMRHDTIVVTGWDKEKIVKSRDKAVGLGLVVSDLIETKLNGYVSFLIATDGSKEGWDASYEGDKLRKSWKDWVKAEESLWVDWVHISYGGDEADKTHIVEHNGLYPEE